MSDQPKPYALGECSEVIDERPFSRSLNPTTGEWTKWDDSLLSLKLPDGSRIECSSTEARDKVIDAHKAALAAERERYRKLLDAERRRCFDLEQQLAAERERHGDEMTEVQLQLQQQLHAMVELLEQTLKLNRTGVCPNLAWILNAEATLAKVKEEK